MRNTLRRYFAASPNFKALCGRIRGTMLEKKKALKYLAIFILIQMLALVLIVTLFDPFYQYHKPLPGLKTVLFERETQVPGSIQTLDYDSVLLGTSVVENCDSAYLDAQFGCKTLKIVKGSGSNADLLYYLDMAHAEQDLQYVFWGIDWHMLTSPTEITVINEYSPSYLFTENPLDDFTYHFNKDVIFKKIPLMVAYSFADINTGGAAYDWSDDKDFSAAKAMPKTDEASKEARSKAIEIAKSEYADEDIFFIGGESVYNEAERYCNTAYITKIDFAYKADRFLLNFDDYFDKIS